MLLKPLIEEAEPVIDHHNGLKEWVKQKMTESYDAEDLVYEVMVRLQSHSCINIKRWYRQDSLASKANAMIINIGKKATNEDRYRGIIEIARASAKSSHLGRKAGILIDKHKLEGIDDRIKDLKLLLQLAEDKERQVDIEEPIHADGLVQKGDGQDDLKKKKKKKKKRAIEKDGSDVKVVSIYGTSGLGKSTLVKKVYDEFQVKKRFDTSAFVEFSFSRVLEGEHLRKLINELNDNSTSTKMILDTKDEGQLMNEIKSFLSNKKFMLVLDDICSIDVWNAIQNILPSSTYGRVIVTTRNAVIASSCSQPFSGSLHYELEPLSGEDAKRLFCKNIRKVNPQHEDFKSLTESFLRKCQGLPLAISALCRILYNEEIPISWNSILNSLGHQIDTNAEFWQMKMAFLNCYNELESHLKSCLLYLSLFPEDHHIEYTRLLRLWIAEGFMQPAEGKTKEEVASDYFDELHNRSLLQIVGRTSDGRVKRCCIGHIFREILIYKSSDIYFAEVARGHNSLIEPERPIIRRLSIQRTLKVEERNIIQSSRLRSLLMFGSTLSKSFISELFRNKLKMLYVLDLQGADIEEFPDLEDMVHLKYISLRSTEVKEIPPSIKKLQNLEALDLKGTKVKKLPDEILKLQRLRYVLVYRYELNSNERVHYMVGFTAPKKIGDMQSLEKLCAVEAYRRTRFSNKEKSIVAELEGLTGLRKLSIIKVKGEQGMDLSKSLQSLTNLRSLSITSKNYKDVENDNENKIDIDMETIDLQTMTENSTEITTYFPQNLQRLYLTGRLRMATPWIESLGKLANLARVHLKWSQLQELNPLVYLQDLPVLVHLELLQSHECKELIFMAGKFKKLKFLALGHFLKLKEIKLQEALPLEKLVIQRCQYLEEVPTDIQGLPGLPSLKMLKFIDMPVIFIDSIRGSQEINNIPRVYSIRWNDDEWEILREPAESSTTVRNQEMRHLWK